MTTVQHPAENLAWYALSAQDVAGQLGVNPDDGLDAHEAERRLEEYGPNALPTEPPPSMWVVARGQLVNPMNIMLLLVVAASFAIVQIADTLYISRNTVKTHLRSIYQKLGVASRSEALERAVDLRLL